MKKINYLGCFIIVFFVFMGQIRAQEKYEVNYSEEVSDWSGKSYKIVVNSNELSDNLEFMVSADLYAIDYIENGYQIHSDMRYIYTLYDNELKKEIEGTNELNEILVYQDNLVEGTKYNIYFFNDLKNYPYSLDEENLGVKGEVVKVNGELCVRILTKVLKSFAMEKEMSQEYKKALEELCPDGYYQFPAVRPTKTIDDGFDFMTYFIAFKADKHNIEIAPIDEFWLENDFQYMTLEFKDIPGEVHVVKYKWKVDKIADNLKDKITEVENLIQEKADSLSKLSSNASSGIYFEIDDLNYINYLYNKKAAEFDNVNGIVNYSSQLKEVFKNNNLKYYFDFRAGNNEPFYNIGYGTMLFGYDGIMYANSFNTGYYVKQVIYIPDDTEDTDEAYMEAAKKRIKEYLEIADQEIKIEVGGTREEVTRDFALDSQYRDAWNKFYDVSKLSDNYYLITLNGETGYFVFEKNSAKIKEVEFKMRDLESDVEVGANTGIIPLDTLLKVKVIGKDHKEFMEILELLQKDDGMIYDISLYSNSLEKYITKLNNGKFKVTIPLNEKYKNKKLKAYYINENNEVEEFDVVVKDGMATFETNHFSTYTLALDNFIEKIEKYFMDTNLKLLNTFIHGFNVGTKIADINEDIIRLGGVVDTNNLVVSTGAKIRFGEINYDVVLYGDITGDGVINSADLLKMRQHLLGTNILSGAYKQAASIINGETINSADLLRLRQYLLKTNTINQ